MLKSVEPTDYQCTLLSLPDRLETSIETIPAKVPYLKAEPELINHWRKQIGSDGFKVGISWQGNPQGEVDTGRSMPLSILAPLSGIPGLRLISLQYQHGLEQIDNLPNGMRVETLKGLNEREDGFIDTAAAMHCMDLVLTTDSAPAHLAGALSLPVWVMLRQVPDWRWLLEGTDSPWYPSMKLFRQRTPGDWTEVVKRVGNELTALIDPKSVKPHS